MKLDTIHVVSLTDDEVGITTFDLEGFFDLIRGTEARGLAVEKEYEFYTDKNEAEECLKRRTLLIRGQKLLEGMEIEKLQQVTTIIENHKRL